MDFNTLANELGMTLHRLATHFDVTYSTIINYRKGITTNRAVMMEMERLAHMKRELQRLGCIPTKKEKKHV